MVHYVSVVSNADNVVDVIRQALLDVEAGGSSVVVLDLPGFEAFVRSNPSGSGIEVRVPGTTNWSACTRGEVLGSVRATLGL